MDRAAAEKEAIRLWRNLPVQDRLTRQQAVAFAAMIAPTLDFDEPARRIRLIEGWLIRDLLQTEAAAAIARAQTETGLAVPGWPQREGAPAIAFVVALLIMIARRPDIITSAMLWAEDGPVYFAQGFNEGWAATLLRPYGGYLQLFPRLVFDLLTLLPLGVVAIAGVWAALIVRAAIPAFLFSSRFSFVDWRAKVALSAYFLLMPNLAEVHANVTSTHWYLGLYLIAVLLADPPRSPGWKIHDWAVLIVAGLTGPMVLFALPVLVLRLVARAGQERPLAPFPVALVGLAAVQLAVLVLSGGADGPWGVAAPFSFVQVLGARVFLGFLTPARWTAALSVPMVAIPVFLLGLAALVGTLVRGGWRAQALAILPVLLVAARLFTPLLNGPSGSWVGSSGLDEPGYFVATSMAWAGALVAFTAIFVPRFSNATLALLVLLGGFLILFDFSLPPVPGTPFGPEVAAIRNAQPGSIVTLETAPPGRTMTLVMK